MEGVASSSAASTTKGAGKSRAPRALKEPGTPKKKRETKKEKAAREAAAANQTAGNAVSGTPSIPQIVAPSATSSSSTSASASTNTTTNPSSTILASSSTPTVAGTTAPTASIAPSTTATSEEKKKRKATGEKKAKGPATKRAKKDAAPTPAEIEEPIPEEEEEENLFEEDDVPNPSDQDVKKLQVIISHFSSEQNERYEYYRRSSFQRSNIKKLMQTTAGGNPINQKMAIVMSGITKIFVGEIVETARSAMDEWGESGPIRARHIREAYRRLKHQGKIPYAKKENLLFQR